MIRLVGLAAAAAILWVAVVELVSEPDVELVAGPLTVLAVGVTLYAGMAWDDWQQRRRHTEETILRRLRDV